MRLVTNIEVTKAIDHWYDYAIQAKLPSEKKSEWDKCHAAFYIGRVFPILHMPPKVRRIAVEAYLAGMEAHSDGSSVVPDSMRYGHTKDWEGVMHDYIFWLHHKGMADASGHVWTLDEANRAYKDAWIADGQALRGHLWYVGLTLGSRFYWAGGVHA
jgi:hypothetical protein